MPQVVVPVRYPISDNSRATLAKAIQVADAEDAALTVLHVNLYQNGHDVERSALKRAVEAEFGHIPRARYVVRSGVLVEETILDEVAAQAADVVVIGRKQASRWRRMIRRIIDDPDIEQFLRGELDCEIVTVTSDSQASRHSSPKSSDS